MSNKKIFLVGFIFAWGLFCAEQPGSKVMSENDVNQVLQEFTETRIGQYLYSDENPRNNVTILLQIIKAHGYAYQSFLNGLKEYNKNVYTKMFPDESHK